jgi:hypothetical protein
MTIFDPLKAAREELAGLNEVAVTIGRRERHAEEAMGKAEVELNALRKITGYVRISMDTIKQRIQELEKEQQRHG